MNLSAIVSGLLGLVPIFPISGFDSDSMIGLNFTHGIISEISIADFPESGIFCLRNILSVSQDKMLFFLSLLISYNLIEQT